VGKAAGAWH